MNHSDLGDGIVFFIASHRNEAQVLRLVKRLRNDLPESKIVIHHDGSKSPLNRLLLPPMVDLIGEPIAAKWGDASLVRLTMRGIEYIASRYPNFSWILFLSGQDYPIRNLRGLPQVLAGLADGELSVETPEHAEPLRYELTWFRLPERLQTPAISKQFDRLIYHLNDRQKCVRFANGRIGCTLGLRLPSPIPRDWRVYQGSQWWTLSRRAILAVLSTKRELPELYDWFVRRTIIPDEGIFQTLLLNRPELSFGSRELRYKRWDDRNSGSPSVLTLRDLADLERSSCFFARKFDSDIDASILDSLDALAARD